MNFQNIPRQDKVVKRAFIPKLDALFFFDYSQIELTLLAYYMAAMGDESMARAITAGNDLHAESARGALGITRDPTDEERQIGKTLNFSLVYGGGRPTITRQLDVSWNEAGKLLRGFHKRWPGVSMLQAAIKDKVERQGFVKTLWGRHLHPGAEHKQLNALVQGCAADLMRSSLITIHREAEAMEWTSHLVSNIHDEIIMDVTESEYDEVATCVPKLMDYEPVSRVVPIRVDPEWSTTTWADKEPYDGRATL
jgi:DNA polymerase-1